MHNIIQRFEYIFREENELENRGIPLGFEPGRICHSLSIC
jgi:hypothetical protein